mgnify:CR=1 FL=1
MMMNKPTEDKEFVAAPAPNEDVVSAPKPPRARVEDAIDPDAEAPAESAVEKLLRSRSIAMIWA